VINHWKSRCFCCLIIHISSWYLQKKIKNIFIFKNKIKNKLNKNRYQAKRCEFNHFKDAFLTISIVVEFVTPGSIDDCIIVLSIIAACGLADRFGGLLLEILRFISVEDTRCCCCCC
jgi:hypothetical protein